MLFTHVIIKVRISHFKSNLFIFKCSEFRMACIPKKRGALYKFIHISVCVYFIAQPNDQPHDVEYASSKYVTSKHCLRDPAVCKPEPGHHIGGLGWHPEDETSGDNLPPVF